MNFFVIGNGGSFANADHIANDLLLAGVAAFTINPATLTCFANDFGYENVFARWLGIVAKKDDVLIALSGSGKSPNILNAIAKAEEIGMEIRRVFGVTMGQDMQRAEEYQLEYGHELWRRMK